MDINGSHRMTVYTIHVAFLYAKRLVGLLHIIMAVGRGKAADEMCFWKQALGKDPLRCADH